MLPIKYKFAMDEKGVLIGAELWQGSEHVTVSMAAEGTLSNGYRWLEVKNFLDNVKLPWYESLENKQAAEILREMHTLSAKEA